MPKHTVGFTYVLSNLAMPGMVKVGWTDALAEDRAKKLRTTGVPLPFTVEFGAETSFPKQAETAAHAMLAEHQVSVDREFFRVPPHSAIEAVRDGLPNAPASTRGNPRNPTASGTTTGSRSPPRRATCSLLSPIRSGKPNARYPSTYGPRMPTATCWTYLAPLTAGT